MDGAGSPLVLQGKEAVSPGLTSTSCPFDIISGLAKDIQTII